MCPRVAPEKCLAKVPQMDVSQSDTVLLFGAGHGSSTYVQLYQFTVHRPGASRDFRQSARSFPFLMKPCLILLRLALRFLTLSRFCTIMRLARVVLGR